MESVVLDQRPRDVEVVQAADMADTQRIHTPERPFQCHCSRRFSRLDNLRQHAQTIHQIEEIPPFVAAMQQESSLSHPKAYPSTELVQQAGMYLGMTNISPQDAAIATTATASGQRDPYALPYRGPIPPEWPITTKRTWKRRNSKVIYRPNLGYSTRRLRPLTSSPSERLPNIPNISYTLPYNSLNSAYGMFGDSQTSNSGQPQLHSRDQEIIWTEFPSEHIGSETDDLHMSDLNFGSFGSLDSLGLATQNTCSTPYCSTMESEDFVFPITDLTFGPNGTTDPMTGLTIPEKWYQTEKFFDNSSPAIGGNPPQYAEDFAQNLDNEFLHLSDYRYNEEYVEDFDLKTPCKRDAADHLNVQHPMEAAVNPLIQESNARGTQTPVRLLSLPSYAPPGLPNSVDQMTTQECPVAYVGFASFTDSADQSSFVATTQQSAQSKSSQKGPPQKPKKPPRESNGQTFSIPLQLYEAFQMGVGIHHPYTTLEPADYARRSREVKTNDLHVLTIQDINFGGRWFNLEVISMIKNSCLLAQKIQITPSAFVGTQIRVLENEEEFTFPKIGPSLEADEDCEDNLRFSESANAILLTVGTTLNTDIESDWEDDENNESEESCESIGSATDHFQPRIVEGHALLEPVLVSRKSKLIDRLMAEFWIIFDQLQNTDIITHNGNSPSTEANAAMSCVPTAAGNFSTFSPPGSKRRLDDEKDPDSDDDIQRRSGPTKNGPDRFDVSSNCGNFACPYRKHNSRKYNVIEWRTCALTSHNTIARVRGHLYRHHRIFQCPRCKVLFTAQEPLDEHFTTIEGCDLSSAEAAEGITANIEKRLRSRKKTSRHQTEDDRWKEIYQILFVGEEIPSPYFEAIQEENFVSPENRELADFQEYSRQELPRIFRIVLETAVNDKAQPIEEELRQELPYMIQTCLDRLFSSYGALRSGSRESESLVPASDAGGATPDRSSHPLQAFFELPIQSASLGTNVEIPEGDVRRQCHGQQTSFDSGYGSHGSASSSSIGEDLSKMDSNDSTAPDIQPQISDETHTATVMADSATISDDVTDSFGPSADGSVPLTIEDMIMAENFDQYLMSTDCINWHRDY